MGVWLHHRWFLIISAMALTPVAFLSADQPNQAAQEAEIRAMVAALGAPRYVVREEASAGLVAHGLAAVGPLRAAERSSDREVRYRASAALREIMLRDRPRLLTLLQNGGLTGPGELDSLPGWNIMAASVSDAHSAKRLLAESLEINWDFLDAVTSPGANVDVLLSARCVELLRNRSQSRRIASRGDIVAVMLCGLMETSSLTDQTLNNVFTIVHHARPVVSGDQFAIENLAFRELASELIERGSQSSAVFQGLNLAMSLELEAGRRVAIGVLQRGEPQAHLKTFAILTLLRLGHGEDMQHIKPLLEDSQLYHSAPSQRRQAGASESQATTYAVQVRDVALACMLHLQGYQLREMGFVKAQKHPNYGFNPATLGFASDAQRQAALLKYHELLED